MVTTTQPALARKDSLGWYMYWEEAPCVVHGSTNERGGSCVCVCVGSQKGAGLSQPLNHSTNQPTNRPAPTPHPPTHPSQPPAPAQRTR